MNIRAQNRRGNSFLRQQQAPNYKPIISPVPKTQNIPNHNSPISLEKIELIVGDNKKEKQKQSEEQKQLDKQKELEEKQK